MAQEEKKEKINIFTKFSIMTAEIIGSPWAFIIACIATILWGVAGPLFQYSDTWQLFINTSTTILTFLIVFIIQNTQNRDSKSIHIKLDELIRSHKPARNTLIDLDSLSDKQLKALEESYKKLGKGEVEEP